MNVREILREHFALGGFDGLCNPYLECGCDVDDLAPCDHTAMDCEPGYKWPCDCGDECRWHMRVKNPKRPGKIGTRMNECGHFSGIKDQFFVYSRLSRRHKWEFTGVMSSNNSEAELYAERDQNSARSSHPDYEYVLVFFPDPNTAPYKMSDREMNEL